METLFRQLFDGFKKCEAIHLYRINTTLALFKGLKNLVSIEFLVQK